MRWATGRWTPTGATWPTGSRASDKTSELVGNRQASTFQTLAALAGHGELSPRATTAKKTAAASGAAVKKTTTKKAANRADETPLGGRHGGGGSDGETGAVVETARSRRGRT